MIEESNKKILLTNIQRFSLHDGPGIRTTVFLKGCTLRCPWCSNPENLSSNIQTYIKEGKEGTYGEYFTSDELYKEVIRDKPFYTGDIKDFNITISENIDDLPGGVTFSGGECLMQMKQLEPLLDRLNSEHIHTAVETCLFVPTSDLNIAIKHIDLFYVDAKLFDVCDCITNLHGNLSLYLSNLKVLFHSKKPVVIRVPVIGGYTDSYLNRSKVADMINMYVRDKSVNLLKIELIKEHNLGTSKYQSLNACNKGYDVPEYKGVPDALMEQYMNEISEKIEGIIPVEICKI